MAETTIRVIIDPSSSPPPTATDTRIKPPTSDTSGRSIDLSLKSSATALVVANGIKNVVDTTLGQVGQITGNQNVQRRIDAAQQLIGYATQIAINPVVGGIAVGAQLITNAISNTVENRNSAIQSEYLLTLRGNRTNGNR